jgi:hypothetical protein
VNQLIDPADYSSFVVTGVKCNGQRFKLCYGPKGLSTALSINLWRGSVWGVLPTGRRELLKRVYN